MSEESRAWSSLSPPLPSVVSEPPGNLLGLASQYLMEIEGLEPCISVLSVHMCGFRRNISSRVSRLKKWRARASCRTKATVCEIWHGGHIASHWKDFKPSFESNGGYHDGLVN